jgi:hypothetical protein
VKLADEYGVIEEKYVHEALNGHIDSPIYVPPAMSIATYTGGGTLVETLSLG